MEAAVHRGRWIVHKILCSAGEGETRLLQAGEGEKWCVFVIGIITFCIYYVLYSLFLYCPLLFYRVCLCNIVILHNTNTFLLLTSSPPPLLLLSPLTIKDYRENANPINKKPIKMWQYDLGTDHRYVEVCVCKSVI